ncbi:RDD family protein [Helicobacter mustelae]|uniref:RDD domain-containing protein n=2 Tax=Helicobacter mustelae TaxID=217 RepID=D3UHN0_HELM1|nr:RDD family protein [Helicobacter mustelae]CBG40002.1 Putative hypothetical protein [Helicobacter mustelae 12198]SQH71514.1 RDD family protein [Helicobacter mustelae]STP12639.1 RDD family protein [Helicobacter mustelae]
MRKDREKIEEMLYREGIEIAPFSKRFFAFLIDEMLISLIFSIALISKIQGKDSLTIINVLSSYALLLLLLRIIYYGVFTYFYGASIGKILLKIKIVQVEDLEIPNLKTTIMRCVCKEIGQMFLYITYLFALGDGTLVRTLHDLLADTIVIQQA